MRTLTIVGVGLIGASIGLAAKNRRLVRRVRGIDQCRRTLERARERGAVDETAETLADAVAGADVVVVCTPVSQVAGQVLAGAAHSGKETLLTDAGSAKSRIVDEVESALKAERLFVGGHPLAGSEKSGPDHAEANLFAGRWAIVTPTERTPTEAVVRAKMFWQGLGARVGVMSPEEHDDALALTSHLPHLLASALAGMLPESLSHLAATGFRDTTRIASGDPALWTAIFEHNRDAVLKALAGLQRCLGEYASALQDGDWNAVDRLLTQAKRVRDALGS